MNLCRRCYIKMHNLKKKDIKHLMSTIDKYQCENCGEYKTIVLETKNQTDPYYYDD